MGPISQGSINDLMALATIVNALKQEGFADALADLKAQMDAIVAKGAEVSEREAALAAREAKVVSDEEYWNTMMARVTGKDADATKRLETATRKLQAVEGAQQALDEAQATFESKVTAVAKELSDREAAVAVKEKDVAGAWEEVAALKDEYEGKLAQLKSIAG